MKTHGDAGWQGFPTYVDVVVPRALDLMKKHRVTATFFIVGQDAELSKNADALHEIVNSGHEIGNHSFHHEPWLHRRSEGEISEELARAEDSIGRVTGQRTIGFRGPGFVRSDALVNALVRRGYAYDASLLPTFIGPLARAYYFKTAKLDKAEQADRTDLFGSFQDGLLPNRRHRVTSAFGSIEEIPVTTMPGFRVPIHLSYVLYLAVRSPKLALAYFRTALEFCRVTKTEPSILLHPLDFISGNECPALRFFPAMNLASEVKLEIVDSALRMMCERFNVMPLVEFCDAERETPQQRSAAVS